VPGRSPSGSGAEGPGRRRRRPFSAEEILATAIRVADEEGLEAVSIRRIAAELDGRPMSFYEHFAGKEQLLWRMADEVGAEALVEDPLPGGWREAMTKLSWLVYGLVVRHPWVVSIHTTDPRFGPNIERQAGQFVAAMSELGLEPEEMWALVGTVNDFVLGHSMRAAHSARPEELEDLLEDSALEAVPELGALPDYLRSRAAVERFEAGLTIVLDGVERAIGR
jgi:AcrR family transcriptional regulator